MISHGSGCLGLVNFRSGWVREMSRTFYFPPEPDQITSKGTPTHHPRPIDSRRFLRNRVAGLGPFCAVVNCLFCVVQQQ